MRSRFLVLFFISLFLISFVSADCTVTLDKTNYFATETATATMSCSLGNEKSISYTLTWRNSSNDILETDTGTTPATGGEAFFETFVFPGGANYTGNVTLTGTNLEGSDVFSVTPTGGTGALLISDVTITPTSELFMGKNLGIQFNVKDENNKKISNAHCQVDLESGDSVPILATNDLSHDGRAQVNFILDDDAFDENRDYRARISCYCGGTGTGLACIDEDGTEVTNSIGSGSDTFTTNTWLTTNTLTGKSLYFMKEEIFICANLSNVNYRSRVPVRIYYEARCSAGVDNDDDLDRALILSDIQNPDYRGIGENTTQMQCKRFVIPEAPHLQGKNSECYASTDVVVLDENDEKVMSYHTTSPVFNISSDEINLYPDWERIGDYTFNSIVNLSDVQFTDYNGTGTGNVDIKLTSVISRLNTEEQQEVEGIEFAHLLASEHIKNITAKNSTGDDINWGLEYLEDGSLEIELRDVDLSPSGYYNVTMYLNSFNERSASALEGIENKTGTFHLSVDCPATGTIGDDMACIITAYVEDSQIVEKEVDFTCEISDGISTYSSVNFNQMITRNAVSIERNFSIPSTFTSGQQYVLQCYADYYNLGSRRDSFYDTFFASASSGGGTSEDAAGGSFGGSSPITGGATGDGGDGGGEGIKFGPITITRTGAFIFIGIIVVLALMIIIYLSVHKKHHSPHHYRRDATNKIFPVIRNILLILLLLVLVIGIGVAIYYLITNFDFAKPSSVQPVSVVNESSTSIVYDGYYSLMQDKLFRGMLLTAFIVIIIIVLFKVLNLRGEIRFGGQKDYSGQGLSRAHNKLNQKILEKELKRERLEDAYRDKKISAAEFFKALDKVKD